MVCFNRASDGSALDLRLPRRFETTALRGLTRGLESSNATVSGFQKLARLKVRFVINQGRHGAPMAKLGKIAEQTERFLRAFASELGLEVKAGDWLAADFKNSSVEFQAEFPKEVPPSTAQIFSSGLEVLADFDPDTEGLNGRVSEASALEYARIGSLLDPDEIIRMGIISPDARAPRWRDITYTSLSSIRRTLEQPVTAHGSVQGILHAWFKEAKEPHFQLRELATDALIKVIYSDELYERVARAVQERNTTLMVDGQILYDKVTHNAIELRADKIASMNMMTPQEFDEVFGCAPSFVSTQVEEGGWLN